MVEKKEKVDEIPMTCQTELLSNALSRNTIHSEKLHNDGGLRIPCTAARRRCRCSWRCAGSPGPPEVEAGTVLSGRVPGGWPTGCGGRG